MDHGKRSSSPKLYISSSHNELREENDTHANWAWSVSLSQVVGTIVQAGYQTVERGSDYFWIRFMFVNGLIIEGSGTLNGNGPYWWSHNCRFNMLDVAACPLPVFGGLPVNFLEQSLHFHGCNGLQLDGLHFKDSARGHISLSNMNGATISNLRISAPGNSRNTDGIDISDSSHIQIRDSFIGTGDDCVAIGGGSSFINISNVLCGPGHGISVGSLGAKGARDTVEEVHVNNCNFTNTMYGLRIKTWQGGSGYARKITFDKIHVNNVGVPIFIDQYYCNGGNNCGISVSKATYIFFRFILILRLDLQKHLTNKTMEMIYLLLKSSAVQVSDVSFRGVTGTSSSQDAIKLSCSRTVGCTNIFMQDINIHPGKASCINAHGRAVRTLPAACLSP
ncbi:hypothetical protein GIB67_021412 [Kingdonia uniflora]|uniref:Polygalacturonase n=1 Tax=Kingdonia uniflora TaxID=39325 RepID=A0A7J7MD44_9MAGN|nr:hypothetical protein GIB67_021412 [Kingdonia uniflora]